LAFGAASNQIGLPLRSRLLTGEIEIRGRDIGGTAVHAAARVMSQSQASEVLVSRVVTNLVDGAGRRRTPARGFTTATYIAISLFRRTCTRLTTIFFYICFYEVSLCCCMENTRSKR
jgi:hypothetical protein